MNSNNKTYTRRDFLGNIGLLALPGMLAWDMLKAAPVYPLPLTGNANGKKIVILGAGLAGMACAYELQKLGYSCVILEARHRSGGRAFSVRRGNYSEETANGKLVANFDEGLYFNAGPSRIPHHHTLTLHYCKELGIPLEVYNNVNEAAYYYSEGEGALSGRKVRKKEMHNDMRGYLMELLAKAVNTSALDMPLTKEDTEKLLDYIRAEGALDLHDLYKGSSRRGYKLPPAAGLQEGELSAPFPLQEIIRSGLTGTDFYNVAEYVYELQQTMLQMKGGNDAIARAFEKRLKSNIHLGAKVTEITNLPEKVAVTYEDAAGPQRLEADYCICTIPLPVLSDITHNFSSPVSRAIDKTVYIMAGKIGMQFRRRFWEEDEMIYGGITHTNNELYQVFYPSNDYHSRKGLLIGYYNFNERAQRVGEMSYAQREQLAYEKGMLIHPQYAQEYEKQSFSISWHKTKYTLGGWAIFSEEERKRNYRALLQPDKQVYFAGEHLSYLNGWMAGALESARSTVTALHNRVTGQHAAYPVVN